MTTKTAIREYLAELGRKGGQATGDVKRRDPAHYARITKLAADGRAKARKRRERDAKKGARK